MKAIKDEKNSVLPRRELTFEVSHPKKSTPNRLSVIEEISKNIKCNKDLILIKKINTPYGSTTSNIKAHVYDDKNEMKVLERISKKPKEESRPVEGPKEELSKEKVGETQVGKKTKA